MPGNLRTFYTGTATSVLAGIGIPTAFGAVVILATQAVLGTLTVAGAAVVVGTAAVGFVAAAAAGLVVTELIIDIGAAAYATYPLVE